MKKLLHFFLAFCFVCAMVSSCTSKPEEAKSPAASAPPPSVDVVEIKGQTVDIYRDVPAQTFARNKVDVRGRVDGYIEKWLFRPGQNVTKGQALYVLDRRPYIAQLAEAKGKYKQTLADAQYAQQQVSLAEAKANLASAQSTLLKTKQDFGRAKELVDQGAISRSEYDAAVANMATAQANVKARTAAVQQAQVTTETQIDSANAKVAAAKAEVESADLNVRYSTITAPVSGLIGDSNIPVGGLVSATSQQPLTTIVPLDPLWVRFKVSESQYLNYRRTHKGAPPSLDMYLADGSKFPHPGTVSNTLNEIDRRTGTLEIQASFPNPEKTVLPGQFARVRYVRDHLTNAITVPIKAVQQTQNLTTVFIVSPDNKAQSRVIKLGPRVGEVFVVEDGLQLHDRVIVEGLLAVRPGMLVNPNIQAQKMATTSKTQKTATTSQAVH